MQKIRRGKTPESIITDEEKKLYHILKKIKSGNNINVIEKYEHK